MSPPAVVVALDPEECVLSDFGHIIPRSGVDQLLFVGREEGLRGGVVKTCRAPAHGAGDAVLGAEVGEFPGGVLPGQPRSLWKITPCGGLRVTRAAVRASMIRLVRR